MDSIKKYILKQVAEHKLSLSEAKLMLQELQEDKKDNLKGDIAIIGMACKFPNGQSPEEYWKIIKNNLNCVDDFPYDRRKDIDISQIDPGYLQVVTGKTFECEEDAVDYYDKGGFLKEIDKFDCTFFNIAPREAKFMDPIQRLFLETSYEAMEDAGYGGNKLYGTRTGVFVGNDHTNNSLYGSNLKEPDSMVISGTCAGILSSRLSYIYNLAGPSIVIDTACSSGLVSVHTACKSLKNKECDTAIAGGIHIIYKPLKSNISKMITSEDTSIRAFDNNANGTVWSEGVGVLLLKPLSKALSDGDNIHAVIKGSAINNDGASNGITAPSAEAQEDVIVRAWEDAEIDPETIAYIEAHGTGTVLGDPIEIKGLTTAFRKYTTKKQFCGIGSVKTNIGHAVAASGLASIIKVTLALKNKSIPGSINFKSPNEFINFCDSPIYFTDKERKWKTEEFPRRAAVSAFGFSGTNCHMILEEAPSIEKTETSSQKEHKILTISAKNKELLMELVRSYVKYLNEHESLNMSDVCYTLNTGRGHYNCNLSIIFNEKSELNDKLHKIIVEDNFIPSNIEGIYFDEIKVISDNKKIVEKGEIKQGDRKKLIKAANIKIKELISLGEDYKKVLEKISDYYVSGLDIDWDVLYKDEKRYRVSLPVYPLERKRCWLDVSNNKRISQVENSINADNYLSLENILIDDIDFNF